MKPIFLAGFAALALTACTNSSNRGLDARGATDTMSPAPAVSRPIQAGGAASAPPAGGTMALPASGGATTTVQSPALDPSVRGTMDEQRVTTQPRR
jgi:hypothetical protein